MKKKLIRPKLIRFIVRSTIHLVLTGMVMYLFSGTVGASPANAQRMKDVEIKLRAGELGLEDFFREIEAQTPFRFTYKGNMDTKQSVALKKTGNLEELLTEVAEKTGFSFQRVNENIAVRKEGRNVARATLEEVTVTGQVVDEETQEPIVGALVFIEGTSFGTTTDASGYFTFQVTEDYIGKTALVSFIGYESVQITLSSAEILVKLSTNELEEVVVVGYGELKMSETTGSVSSVGPREFNRGVIGTPDQLLQGKVAGMNITRSGDPNENPSIILRGPSTLRGGAAQEPFYVIDGVPGANIHLVAPDDIIAIDVLKDAAATAIYGARAANGVIMISTKRSKAGQFGLSVNSYTAFETISNTLDMLSADGLRDFLGQNNRVLNPADDDGVSTNWQDEVTRTGVSQNHSVSFGGGTEKSVFNANINYFKQEGIIKNSESDRLSGRLSLDQKLLDDRVNLSFNLYNSIRNQQFNPDLVFYNMYRFLPTSNVYNADGSFKEDLSRVQYYNPLSLIENNWENRKTNTLLANAMAKVHILDNLVYDLSISLQNESVKGGAYQTRNSSLAQGANGIARRYTFENERKVLETFLTYSPEFSTNHDLKVLGGYSWQEDNNGDGFQATNRGFIDDLLGYNNLALGNPPVGFVPNYGNFINSQLRLISLFSRVNYSFKDKYYLQASVRRDGSSAFGENNRWGTFPAVSAAWRITNESFMQHIPAIDELKFRVGYGVTGNSLGFDPYISILRYGAVGTFYNNGQFVQAIGPTQNDNPNLRWEKTGMFNAGFDFSLFNGKLSGVLEYYDKQTSDLIWSYPVSTTQYFVNSLTANVGAISNKGVELTLNYYAVNTAKFKWNISGNLAHNRNVVTALSDDNFQMERLLTAQPGGQGQSGISTQVVQEGYPIGQFFTPVYAGKNDAGVSQYVSRDGSMTLNPVIDDYQFTGNAQPALLYGISNTFVFGNWDLNIFFRGVAGNEIMNATLADLNRPADATSYNVPTYSVNESLADNNSYRYSTRFIENGSYLRLDNMTIGYKIPWKSDGIKLSRVYATGQNLFILTDYTGIDPEINLGGLTPGLDNKNFYPKTRSFLIGINLEF